MAEDAATFGGGCFWCLESVFSELRGVQEAISGYAGGTVESPTYEQVCTGKTGHAEVVRVVYDPQVITYSQLLQVFFAVHDPTTLNRQGNDVGTQYRSVIFYHSETQKEAAAQAVAQLTREKVWKAPIVTALEPLTQFYPAEEYHRDYFARHPEQMYCRLVVAPKMSKFRKSFTHLLRVAAPAANEAEDKG